MESVKTREIEHRVQELRAKALAEPDVRPTLATALLDLSRCLKKDNRYSDAIAAAREGIETLSSMFVDDPTAFKDEMYALVTQYTSLCSHASTAPDKALLAPIAAAFGREME